MKRLSTDSSSRMRSNCPIKHKKLVKIFERKNMANTVKILLRQNTAKKLVKILVRRNTTKPADKSDAAASSRQSNCQRVQFFIFAKCAKFAFLHFFIFAKYAIMHLHLYCAIMHLCQMCILSGRPKLNKRDKKRTISKWQNVDFLFMCKKHICICAKHVHASHANCVIIAKCAACQKSVLILVPLHQFV